MVKMSIQTQHTMWNVLKKQDHKSIYYKFFIFDILKAKYVAKQIHVCTGVAQHKHAFQVRLIEMKHRKNLNFSVKRLFRIDF